MVETNRNTLAVAYIFLLSFTSQTKQATPTHRADKHHAPNVNESPLNAAKTNVNRKMAMNTTRFKLTLDVISVIRCHLYSLSITIYDSFFG
jgi:hypothetical protein